MKTLTNKDLFVDDLDGKWTLGFYDENGGSESIGCFKMIDGIHEDMWLYPKDLNELDNVICVWNEEGEGWKSNVYTLPENWKDIVTWDSGKDGKASIHDIMIEQTYII